MIRSDTPLRERVLIGLLGLCIIGGPASLYVLGSWAYYTGTRDAAQHQSVELIAWQTLAERLARGEEPTEVWKTARQPTGIVKSPRMRCAAPTYWRVIDLDQPGQTRWDRLPEGACEFEQTYDPDTERSVLVFRGCEHLEPPVPC